MAWLRPILLALIMSTAVIGSSVTMAGSLTLHTSPSPLWQTIENSGLTTNQLQDQAQTANRNYTRELTDTVVNGSFRLVRRPSHFDAKRIDPLTLSTTSSISLRISEGGYTIGFEEPYPKTQSISITSNKSLNLNNGSNYQFIITDHNAGGEIIVTPKMNMTPTQSITFFIHDPDGGLRSHPEIWGAGDGPVPVNVTTNGSITNRGVVNYSVSLVDASNDTPIATTASYPFVVGYAGVLTQNTTTDTIQVSLPRDILPQNTNVSMVVYNTSSGANTPNEIDQVADKVRFPLTYNSTTDAFVGTFDRCDLGDDQLYSWRAKADLPQGEGISFSRWVLTHLERQVVVGNANTTIQECSVITQPGRYDLGSNLQNSSDTCVVITSSDIHFDGNGHIINTSESGRNTGLFVRNLVTSAPVSNITIANVTISGWHHGITANSRNGTWVIRNSVIESNEDTGIDASGSTGDWMLINVTARHNDGPGVDASGSTGDWTIRATDIIHNDAEGVDARAASGNWTIQHSTIRNTSFDGVDAAETSGAWVIQHTTIHNTSSAGVSAGQSTGAWVIRMTRIWNIGYIGISAYETEGAWSIHNSSITQTEFEGLDSSFADQRGDASFNYWGAPDGPSGAFNGSGVAVIGNVTVQPFYPDDRYIRENLPITVGAVAPTSVTGSKPVEHTVTFAIKNLSKDGNTDVVLVTFPDEVAEKLSGIDANITNRTNEAEIAISSSLSKVDGPDNDSVRDTLRVAVSPDGSGTIQAHVNISANVTWPSVETKTVYPIRAAIRDSATGEIPLTTVASVTIKSPVTLGDVNGDETINTGDVIQVQRSIVGLSTDPAFSSTAADVNSDGSVNTGDVIQIQRFIVGLSSVLD